MRWRRRDNTSYLLRIICTSAGNVGYRRVNAALTVSDSAQRLRFGDFLADIIVNIVRFTNLFTYILNKQKPGVNFSILIYTCSLIFAYVYSMLDKLVQISTWVKVEVEVSQNKTA